MFSPAGWRGIDGLPSSVLGGQFTQSCSACWPYFRGTKPHGSPGNKDPQGSVLERFITRALLLISQVVARLFGDGLPLSTRKVTVKIIPSKGCEDVTR